MWTFSATRTTPDDLMPACADQSNRLIDHDASHARRLISSSRPSHDRGSRAHFVVLSSANDVGAAACRSRRDMAGPGFGNGRECETARPATESHSNGDHLVATVMFFEGGT
ncbi:hypothetical protein [Nocardia suismassiliense]|uniref:hypothetical protein n=1 Tax=Nocardia suismassiliense TaxID=2077092 RepID=UPI00131F319E|nr:hypothetical protein [Nocardia suismassiliense]